MSNSKNGSPTQANLFSELMPRPPIRIELSGLGPIPSFKNRKLIRAWIDKAGKILQFFGGRWWIRKDSIKIRSMLYLEPEIQKWMDTATHRIESQLFSALATSEGGTRTGVLPHSVIVSSLPLDDCWTAFRQVVVISELCEPGLEGATIVIERL